MKPDWIPFDVEGPLPPERRYVLVMVAELPEEGRSSAVAVGWLRIHSEGPFFVVPAIGGPVTHWADCLGDNFEAPLWAGKQT